MAEPMDYDEEQDIVGTLDVIGKAWIPIRPVTGTRQSLPGQLSSSVNNKDHSTSTVATNRRSLSPSRLMRRASGASLSLLPDVSMQHSKLKARAATAERALIEQNATHGAALHKATERIKALELEREKIRLELEGWKAEAERFEGEASNGANVASLEQQLAEEQRKKRRLKEDNKRLNIELRSRREREKWDLAIYDADDRKLMNEMTQLEMKVSQLEGWLAIRELDLEDAHERLADARSEAEATREKHDELAQSNAALEATVASLNKDLGKSKTNTATESELKKLRVELATLTKTTDKLKRDLESAQESNESLEEELRELRKSNKGSSKDENEVKELKSKLKAAESESRAKDKEIAKANASAKTAQDALDKARQKAKDKREERQRIRAASSSVPPSDGAVSDVTSSPRAAKPRKAANVKKGAKKAASVATSEVESAGEHEEDESTATVRPAKASTAAATNKRKAEDVLWDKSNNSSTGVAASKGKGAASANEPAKKKMRMLGGATRKFEWGAAGVENANVNTLGIPMDLSPIKASQPKGGLLSGLLGGGGKIKAKSLFG